MQTPKAQTSLHIQAVWSPPLLFAHWKVQFLDLLQAKFQSVAGETGLSLALLETPKTGLSFRNIKASGPVVQKLWLKLKFVAHTHGDRKQYTPSIQYLGHKWGNKRAR